MYVYFIYFESFVVAVDQVIYFYFISTGDGVDMFVVFLRAQTLAHTHAHALTH